MSNFGRMVTIEQMIPLDSLNETKKQIYILNLNWFLILSSRCELWQGGLMITK